MCVISDKYISKKIAQKDIKVYKVLLPDDDGFLHGPVYTWNQTYTVGKEAISPLDNFHRVIDMWWSDRGLYSYSKKRYAKRYLKGCDLPYTSKIYKCTIPKGSEYLFNGIVYVSNKLLINKECIIQ